MDHVVYLDAKSNELENLIAGRKKIIIRGAMGRKLPYGRVNIGDTLYFLRNNGEGVIKAKAKVPSVFYSDKLTKEESIKLVEENKSELMITDNLLNRFSGKRYIIFITVEDTKPIEEFEINKSQYSNMDDWLPVEEIEKVKIKTKG